MFERPRSRILEPQSSQRAQRAQRAQRQATAVSSVGFRVLSGCALALATVTGAQSRSVWDGVYTDAQAKRGEALYADRCASCHAPDLSGLDQAPPLTGADFGTEWNDTSLNDLFERIRISMPGDKPGSLDRQQVADALAFILNKNNFPAGAMELTTEAEDLKAIRFVTKRL